MILTKVYIFLSLFLSCFFFTVSVFAKFGLGNSDYLWKNKSVRVCWGNTEDLALAQPKLSQQLSSQDLVYFQTDLKAVVQNSIQQEFTSDKTGIEFVGWEDCSRTNDFDIVVVGVENFRNSAKFKAWSNAQGPDATALMQDGEASIGTKENDSLQVRTTLKGYVYLTIGSWKVLSIKDSLILTALHEFGHAAGLTHEHYRPEPTSDKNKKATPEELEKLAKLKARNSSAQAYTAYDPTSIMNYRQMFMLKLDTGIRSKKDLQLSPGDIHTLSCLYKPETMPANACKKLDW